MGLQSKFNQVRFSMMSKSCFLKNRVLSVVLCFALPVSVFSQSTSKWNPCMPKEFGSEAIVCVCTELYCDSLPPVKPAPGGTYLQYVTSKSGLRFQETVGTFVDTVSEWPIANINVDQSKYFQTIYGWGGAFTDSAGMDITSLSEDLQDVLLRALFSEEGNEFSLCRVPMASTDFSTKQYTYDDDVNMDPELKYFSLQPEDYTYKIPLIQKAMELSPHDLKLIATPWTAPKWMKQDASGTMQNFIKKEYYQAWANYYVRFLDEYEKNSINFWGVTTGNEPINGYLTITPIKSLGWDRQVHANWIADFLGPTIRFAFDDEIKIIAHDDNRILIPFNMPALFDNDKTLKYIDGIGIHWYSDPYSPAALLSFATTPKKQLFLLGTEAANGVLGTIGFEKFVDLGSWQRAANYIESILTDLSYNFSGWLDWNLAVNLDGGHSWTLSGSDSQIVVNTTGEEFYKQPTYYAFGHFSKFVPPGSARVDSEVDFYGSLIGIQSVSFQRPDKGVVVIVYNKGIIDHNVVINTKNRGKIVVKTVRNSITTIVFW